VSTIARRAVRGLVFFQVALAGLLFLPAWSLRFWQAWGYWTLFAVSTLSITLYFLKHDPDLVARRLAAGPGAEPQPSEKIIQGIASVLWCALCVVPGCDHRWHWSAVPTALVLAGDLVVGAAFLGMFRVFRENSYAASVIRVEARQRVIATGPYRFVRHPMYAAGLLMFVATPLALGSWWALLVAVPLGGVIVMRLLDEERYLSAHLPGYEAYRGQVRSRLIPGVW
jgi:protein-S-isoprenylcysteine O-methyltransferase Ste14